MTNINYVIGDATRPIGDGKKIICHICNDKGRWGAGFVLALSARWKAPEERYRLRKNLRLGDTQIMSVEPNIFVANMVAQHDTVPSFVTYPNAVVPVPPIRYAAVRVCLAKVNEFAHEIGGATLHMPRIGCGLAGGKWKEIEKIIQDTCDVDVYVYDLKQNFK